MLKKGNVVTRSSAVGEIREPGQNVTADTGKGGTLRRYARRDRERQTTELVEAGTKHNKAVHTGSNMAPKRCIGSVRLTRG